MMDRRDFLGLLPVGLAVFAWPVRARAGAEPVFNTDGIAIHGYDPVGYFENSAATDGDDRYRLRWRGSTWRFANGQNMEIFESNPMKFAPRYGGYCAYAMSKGAVATSVPEAWTIHEDRLYLNFSLGVRDIWRQDIPGNIERADGHWPAALG